MNTRTLIAAIIGVIIGSFAGYYVATAGYAAVILLLFWSFIGTLVVSGIANQRIILVGMIPNIVMVIVVMIRLPTNHVGIFEVVAGSIYFLILMCALSLLITVPVHFLRAYLKRAKAG